MKRHKGSKQKPLPNLPSTPRPTLNSVMGTTVSTKASVCVLAEGSGVVEWLGIISWASVVIDMHRMHQHVMRIAIICRQITGTAETGKNQPHQCSARTSPERPEIGRA